MSNSLIKPNALSSLYFAHRAAPAHSRPALCALHTLHHRWREAATFNDPHHAVTTLNWWHHELEKSQVGEINHPALLALRPWLNPNNPHFFTALQGLLHGHMHWHHLTRIETLEQLQPTIDAIAGSYMQTWSCILNQTDNPNYSHAAGQMVWWIDQTRHIGHSLAPSRLWLPMDWLTELNLPAHVILNRKASVEERMQNGSNLLQKLISQSKKASDNYTEIHAKLPAAQAKAVQSIHLLTQQRALLLNEISQQPQDVWAGLVSISPHRKWWLYLRR